MRPRQQDIEWAARTYRAAIDAAGPEPWKKQGRTFPRGACAHAAELLGRYLHDQLGINADYVAQNAVGNLGGWEGGHAWLEWDDLTIDISGDQFGWEPIIVTRSPLYHGRGDPEARHPVINPHTAEWFEANCGGLWREIGERLRSR